MKRSLLRIGFLTCLVLCAGSLWAAAAPKLPIVDKTVTFTVWQPIDAETTKVVQNLADSEYFKELERRTGVHAAFIHPTIGQERESLNILFASGEYPDIVQVYQTSYFYPGGNDKGIADGVILRLNELVDTYAPNYKALINAVPDLARAVKTDEGNLAAFFQSIREVQPPWIGMTVRQDWLDDLGLKRPETYDDWHAMLKAFKEKKNAEAPMMLYFSGFHPYDVFIGGYGVASSFYHVDGKVEFGPLEPGYREYLAMMSQWYKEGLVDKDFATKKDFLPSATYTTTGKAGAWEDIYIMLSVDKARSKDPKFRAVGVPTPAKTRGQSLHIRNRNNNAGMAWAVTRNCKDPVTAVKWLDYNYCEEGMLLANYGIRGKTYTIGSDGKPRFTDLMTKNPDGLSLAQAMRKYVKLPSGGFEYHWERELAGQPKDNLDAQNVWLKNNDGAWVMPGNVTLTSEEGSESARIMGDINTYISEMAVKFITGIEPLGKYEAFVAQIRAMNIDRAIRLQQASLDRYNKR